MVAEYCIGESTYLYIDKAKDTYSVVLENDKGEVIYTSSNLDLEGVLNEVNYFKGDLFFLFEVKSKCDELAGLITILGNLEEV